jgi:hypothetical protein
MISLSVGGNAVVILTSTILKGIKIDGTANGALSLSGQVQSLTVQDCVFENIKTGNAGGALFLAVSYYNPDYGGDTYIVNSVCIICDGEIHGFN